MKTLKDFVKKGLFYKSVVEDGSDIIFIVDYGGEIIYHNASVKETLGHKPNSLVGKSFFDFILPETLPSFKHKYQASCRKRYHETVEFQFLCKDGTYKYLEFNSINLKQKEGVQGLILDCRDIMQRKKDAEELLRAQKAKEQFLANISHEIRTPINGIAGMATLLSKNHSREEEITYLSAIKSAADNLKVIINDILDLASIDSGKLKFETIGFSLKDLIESLVGSFSVQAKDRGIELTFTVEKEADKILKGDPVRLNQILINLISNALKFTHAGFIRIRISNEHPEKERCSLRFDVMDTGIGIPQDKLTTIFESFSQADASVTRKYGGTGLGLTIVKQLVELQHGSISVTSKEGEGSTFTVRIPYPLGSQEDITEMPLRDGHALHRNSLRNMNVLLVEDNDINRLYASSILKTWDCNLEMAENGYVAVEKAKNVLFDIILMDIQMPVMDGFEATKAIRSGDLPMSKVPIIALTANATRQDTEKCLNAGMNDCISKPFTPEELFKILTRYSAAGSVAPSPAPKPTSIHVDLRYLKTIMKGNPEFISEMINTFLSSMPQSIDDIRRHTKGGDWEKVGRAVHKIKPSLTMMGLPALGTKAMEIEEGIRVGMEPDFIATEASTFADDLDKALDSLRAVSPSSAPPA
jgi:PAS domain S-box-containing protein